MSVATSFDCWPIVRMIGGVAYKPLREPFADSDEGVFPMTETLSIALPKDVEELTRRMLEEACDRSIALATAESCTGGLLAFSPMSKGPPMRSTGAS
ncbi:hypothetical protein [Aurantimonas sp. C2-4-R8]